MAETPEIPEIPAVPAETPPAEAASPRPEPSGASLGGAGDAEVNNQTSLLDSGSPAAMGSYATLAPSTFEEAPAPAEAASALFVAGYGSASADLPLEQPSPEAAPALFVAGYGSASADLLPEQPSPEAAPALFVAGYGSTSPESAAAGDEASPSSDPTAALATTPGNVLGEEPPGIATSIVVPPLPAGEAGEGGEWELLRSKVSTWFDDADLQARWESLGGPLRAAGLLLAAVLLLRLYSALLETLGDLPLVPRLLQLVGLLCVARFALTKLVRSSERERILTSWGQRWNDFRGRD